MCYFTVNSHAVDSALVDQVIAEEIEPRRILGISSLS